VVVLPFFIVRGVSMLNELMSVVMADKVPYLESPPGWGKTSVAKILAKHLADKLSTTPIRVAVVFLAQRAGNEIHGLPVISPERVLFDNREMTIVEQAPPAYAVEAARGDSNWLLIFDELNQLSPSDAGQAMSIFTERRIGDVNLSRNFVGMVAAGNPVEVSAGGWTLPPPLRRRVVALKMEANTSDFAASSAFPDNWGQPIPEIVKFGKTLDMSLRRRFRLEIAAWAHKSPDLFDVPKDITAWNDGFACPATLEDGADLLASMAQYRRESLSDEAYRELQYTVLSGAIGPGNANSFLEFSRKAEIPDPLSILNNPAVADHEGRLTLFSSRPDLLYFFLLTSLEALRYSRRSVAEVKQKTAADRAVVNQHHTLWENFFLLMKLLHEKYAASPDVVAMAIATAVRPDLKDPRSSPPKILNKMSELVGLARQVGLDTADVHL
jgi:hypothetical protein